MRDYDRSGGLNRHFYPSPRDCYHSTNKYVNKMHFRSLRQRESMVVGVVVIQDYGRKVPMQTRTALERRRRIYRLPVRMLVEFIQAVYTSNDEQKKVRLRFPLAAIPEGARVVCCQAHWSSESVEVMLEHESFPPVWDGCEVPYGEVFQKHFVDIA